MFITQLFTQPAYFITVVVIVIVSISVHELFHALAARWQGDDTAVLAGHLTLDPRVHMGQTSIILLMLFGLAWGSTPVNQSRLKWPFSPALVSFAGPFANLLMMTLSIWMVLGLEHNTATLPAEGLAVWGPWIEAIQRFLSLAALMNAFLFLLNMLPLPPLDGFGILETFVPVLRRYGFSLSQYGFFILMVLFFFGLGSQLFGLAGLMVWKVTAFSQGMIPAL
jgi:Zn-dependent protease